MELSSYFDAMSKAKKEYSRCLEPVCRDFGLTQNELAVLLFLRNNPGLDRAADIVSCRSIAKSHVSLDAVARDLLGYGLVIVVEAFLHRAGDFHLAPASRFDSARVVTGLGGALLLAVAQLGLALARRDDAWVGVFVFALLRLVFRVFVGFRLGFFLVLAAQQALGSVDGDLCCSLGAQREPQGCDKRDAQESEEARICHCDMLYLLRLYCPGGTVKQLKTKLTTKVIKNYQCSQFYVLNLRLPRRGPSRPLTTNAKR